MLEPPDRSLTTTNSFPTFDGKEDLIDWLNRCESFFRGHCTLETHKVWLASFYLSGAAAQHWFFMLERDEPLIPWPRFKALNCLGEVARLPFWSSVEDYQERFLALLCHAETLPPPHQLAQHFNADLPERLRVDVELCASANLQ
ncbi:hypothetical protein U9M48_011282 [Paspalum notatum var. saurae]|uniref:Retrotransposon gag domain-containing protein n=1 Tax=Paspalum notatum var. saurae TaxID=547442 RepID=A0AAQ3SV92_PASNO